MDSLPLQPESVAKLRMLFPPAGALVGRSPAKLCEGKIGSEVMLVRLAEEKFYVVSYPEQDHIGLPNGVGLLQIDGVGGPERFMQRP